MRPLAAEQSPWTLAELQRQFAYDRFLQRLNARDDGWVLKGAAALLAREVSLRTTRDVDLYRRGGLMEAEITLREALALDLGDWFTFDVGRSRAMTAGVMGLTIAVTASTSPTSTTGVGTTRSKLAKSGDSQSGPWAKPRPSSAPSSTRFWRIPLPARGTRSPCAGAACREGGVTNQMAEVRRG